jgi:hypothetical protein
VSDSPHDLLAVGPAARIIWRRGSRRVVLLQPALLGESIVVPLVIELGADDKPVPEQDGRQLAIKPTLTALEREPVPLWPESWGTGGGYRALACTAFFRAAGHAYSSLRLDVAMPLLGEPVSYVFALEQH